MSHETDTLPQEKRTPLCDTPQAQAILSQINALLHSHAFHSASELDHYKADLKIKATDLFKKVLQEKQFPHLAELYLAQQKSKPSHQLIKMHALIYLPELMPLWEEVAFKKTPALWEKSASQSDNAYPTPYLNARKSFPEIYSFTIKNAYLNYGISPPKARHPFDVLMGDYLFCKAKPYFEPAIILREALFALYRKEYDNALSHLNVFLTLKPSEVIQTIIENAKPLLASQTIDKAFIYDATQTLEQYYDTLSSEAEKDLILSRQFGDFRAMEKRFELDLQKLDRAMRKGTHLSSVELTDLLDNTDMGGMHFAAEFLLRAALRHHIARYYFQHYKSAPNHALRLLDQAAPSKADLHQKCKQYLNGVVYYSQLALALKDHFPAHWRNAHESARSMGAVSCLYPNAQNLEKLCDYFLTEVRPHLSSSEIDDIIRQAKSTHESIVSPDKKAPECKLVQKGGGSVTQLQKK